jgi:hypothetical protein
MQAITKSDLLTIIEEVGFGSAVVGGADQNGIVVDGYLNLTSIARRLDRLVERRLRQQSTQDQQAH